MFSTSQGPEQNFIIHLALCSEIENLFQVMNILLFFLNNFFFFHFWLNKQNLKLKDFLLHSYKVHDIFLYSSQYLDLY